MTLTGWWDPEKQQAVPCGQGAILGTRAELEQHVGRVMEILCNGVMPSGSPRHNRFIRWRDGDKPAGTMVDC